ncbi:glycosyltransferase family 52 protein [bacterium 210820-DFI.6.37]|nr:glycosyltransferase family 52 protein [bacterium 210820-DFI.6.37]
MKSFVVMTYYQLMHAVAFTLELGKKTNLYFAPTYLNIEEDFLDKIRQTGVFNEVIGLYQDSFIVPYIEELKAIKEEGSEAVDEIGTGIFEKYLEPHYASLFQHADFNDDIYVYNDFQWHYYYIVKHFKSIIGVEDGYQSIKQQLKIHRFKGNYKLVEPFLEKYYPVPLYRHEKVKKIITSCDFPDIDQYYRDRFQIIDFKQLVRNNKSDFLEAMLSVFSLEELQIEDNSVLILGTPIARAKYCNAIQGYLFYQKIIRDELNKNEETHIYIKPHPADTLDYCLFESERVTVLDKKFPIELLEYRGDLFEKAISLGSTAIMDTVCKQNVLLYQGTGAITDIKKYIKTVIGNDKLVFNVYIKVESITEETYINIISYLKAYQNIDLNINILVRKELKEKFAEFCQITLVKKEIALYKARYKHSNYRAYFQGQIKQLKQLEKGIPKGVSYKVRVVESFDEEIVYQTVISKDNFDYMLVTNSNNLGSAILAKCVKALKDDTVLGYTFLNYTHMDKSIKQKTFLGNGAVGCCYTNTYENRILHKKIFAEIPETCGQCCRLDLAMSLNHERIKRRASMTMYLSSIGYRIITDGRSYYLDNVEQLIAEQNKYSFSNETLSSFIALQVKEYYNWINLHTPKLVTKLLWDFVESINTTAVMKQMILQQCMECFMWEKQVRQTKRLCQDEEVYDYSRKIIDELLQSGLIGWLTEWSNYRKKTKKRIDNLKKRVKGKLKRCRKKYKLLIKHN